MQIEALQAVTDDHIWARGLAYFRDGRVIAQDRDSQRINAQVAGSEPDPYEVSIVIDSDPADDRNWSCNCPMGVEAELCKHVVAVCLAAANAHVPVQGTTRAKRRPGRSRRAADDAGPAPQGLATFLRDQSSEALAQRLLAFADQLPEVGRELRFWMATAQVTPGAELRKAVSGMLGSPRWLDWRASNVYALRLDTLLRWLEGLRAEQPAITAEACHHALLRLFVIYGRSDDSDGAIGDRICLLAQLHAEACTHGASSPEQLAAALLKLQLADQWGMIALPAYVPALGETGRAHYGNLLEQQWVREQAGTQPAQVSVRRLLEDWYTGSGQIDRLIELQSASLSRASDFLRLIDTCRRHDRARQALQWAERAAKAFPDDNRVLDVLAPLLLEAGFAEEALPIRWRQFQRSAGADTYLALRAAAEDAWPQWRTRALAWAQQGEQGVVGLRVELLVAEQSLGEALALARQHKCEAGALITLARAIERDHPEQAAVFYRRVIEAILPTRTGRYDDVISLLKTLRRVMGDAAAQAYASQLRDRFPAKRRFTDDLARAGLIPP